MNRKQKQDLAGLIIRGMADALTDYENDPESFPEHDSLRDLFPEELYAQVAKWAKDLPGINWDSRLPL
jgi:hypothetical protein